MRGRSFQWVDGWRVALHVHAFFPHGVEPGATPGEVDVGSGLGLDIGGEHKREREENEQQRTQMERCAGASHPSMLSAEELSFDSTGSSHAQNA